MLFPQKPMAHDNILWMLLFSTAVFSSDFVPSFLYFQVTEKKRPTIVPVVSSIRKVRIYVAVDTHVFILGLGVSFRDNFD